MGRHGISRWPSRADRWAKSKRNSISLADRLLRPRARAPPFIPEISIREHVDIEKTGCSSRCPLDVSIIITDTCPSRFESINIPETGRSVSFPGDL